MLPETVKPQVAHRTKYRSGRFAEHLRSPLHIPHFGQRRNSPRGCLLYVFTGHPPSIHVLPPLFIQSLRPQCPAIHGVLAHPKHEAFLMAAVAVSAHCFIPHRVLLLLVRQVHDVLRFHLLDALGAQLGGADRPDGLIHWVSPPPTCPAPFR